MATNADQILSAIRSAIAEAELELRTLRELERIALCLGGQEPPAPSKTEVRKQASEKKARAPRKPRSAHRPTPTAEEIVDGVRDMLADEPRTVRSIGEALGLSIQNPKPKNVIRQALEQLGAVVVGSRNGGAVYALPTSGSTHQAPNGNGNDQQDEPVDRDYLVRRLVRVLEREPLSAEEAAAAIDAPVGQVAETCAQLVQDGTVSQMRDGSYVA